MARGRVRHRFRKEQRDDGLGASLHELPVEALRVDHRPLRHGGDHGDARTVERAGREARARQGARRGRDGEEADRRRAAQPVGLREGEDVEALDPVRALAPRDAPRGLLDLEAERRDDADPRDPDVHGRPSTSDAFSPPKPNEFDTTVRSRVATGAAGTLTGQAGSGVS